MNARDNFPSAAAAYAAGRQLHDPWNEDRGNGNITARLASFELRAAVDSWTAAQTEHAHTSYYGAEHVRQMRAYWLGALRTRRERRCTPRTSSSPA
jgi:hypothetical protein